MQKKSSRVSLLFFSPFSLMFREHQKHNLIRRCIEVVITAPTRNRVNRRKTGPWVRIPPPPPHQFPRGNPLGSWFFIGLRSKLPLIRSPSRPPRTAWNCSPDGHRHWLWSRNRCDRAIPGSASWGRRWKAAETRSYAGDRESGYAAGRSYPATSEKPR